MEQDLRTVEQLHDQLKVLRRSTLALHVRAQKIREEQEDRPDEDPWNKLESYLEKDVDDLDNTIKFLHGVVKDMKPMLKDMKEKEAEILKPQAKSILKGAREIGEENTGMHRKRFTLAKEYLELLKESD